MSHPDAIVIGGGLHGCSAALQLAKRGLAVTLIEKDHVGRHASGVNAGGVRRLGRHYAEVPLSVAALKMWHQIRELVDDDCGFDSYGQVQVAESEAELETLRTRVAELNALGFTHEELIDEIEMRRLVPAIAPHCVGAVVSRADGAANPFRTTMAFKRAAERAGAQVIEGTAVTNVVCRDSSWRVETATGAHEAGIVVNCGGAWGERISAAIGDPVPIQVIAPMLMITLPLPPFIKPVLLAAGRPLSFKQYANGTVLIGGGYLAEEERDRNWTQIEFAGLARSARTCLELVPLMRAAVIARCWAGIEGRMPDGIPVIGPSAAAPNAFHAFGFSAHGFQLGPIVGKIIADLAVDGRTDLPISPFRPDRFAAA